MEKEDKEILEKAEKELQEIKDETPLTYEEQTEKDFHGDQEDVEEWGFD